MTLDIILITSFLLILAYLYTQRRPANYPPGPFGIPIFGHLLQMGEKPFLKFQNEWKKKYGPIISVQFGSYPTVVISDYKLAKKAFMDPKVCGRPDLKFIHDRSMDTCARGVIFTEGEEHNEQRKAMVKFMKEQDLSKACQESTITSATLELLEFLKKLDGQPISVKYLFHSYILQILWPMVAGNEAGDKETLTDLFIKCTKIQEETMKSSSLCMFIPWWATYFPNISGYNYMNGQLGPLWKLLRKHIDYHKSQMKNNPAEVYPDIIGSYLKEMSQATDPKSSFYGKAGENSLMSSLLDLFFAGTETTALTLSWAMLYLTFFSEAQEKLCEEINRVVGDSRLPRLSDDAQMPYTKAVVLEVLRMSSLLPLGVFRSTLDNVELCSYNIPKNTMVLANFYGAHHDQDYWGDPEVFRPDRFLSPDGKSIVKHDNFLPFSVGKRACVGEALAKNEIFLFLAFIFQRFNVSLDPSNVNPSLEPTVAFTLMPPDHKLVFSQRKQQQ